MDCGTLVGGRHCRGSGHYSTESFLIGIWSWGEDYLARLIGTMALPHRSSSVGIDRESVGHFQEEGRRCSHATEEAGLVRQPEKRLLQTVFGVRFVAGKIQHKRENRRGVGLIRSAGSEKENGSFRISKTRQPDGFVWSVAKGASTAAGGAYNS